MQPRNFLRSVAAAATLLTHLPAAQPHYLWLESEGAGARLYFGEVNEVRERSPGRLDEIAAPRVRTAGGAPIAVQRRAGDFALDGRVGTDLVAFETGYEVKDWTASGIGVVKPMFYARHTAWPVRQAVPATPELRLDVQPVRGARDVVRILFDGQPLAAAKLVVHAPNGWDREHKADEQGRVTLALPWRGQYVLEAIHKEIAPGEFEGRKYEAQRHRATLAFVRRDGIDPAGTGTLAPRHPER